MAPFRLCSVLITGAVLSGLIPTLTSAEEGVVAEPAKSQKLAVAGAVPVGGARREADSWIRRGDAHDARMETARALECYLEALEHGAESPDLLIKIAKQYGESMCEVDGEEAKLTRGMAGIAYANRALAQAPDDSLCHLGVAITHGRVLDLIGNKTRVEYSRLIRHHAEKAVALDPQSDYAWHILGRWHQSVARTGKLTLGLAKIVYGGVPDGSLEESARCFEEARRLNPNRVSHHVELGRTYYYLGESEKARVAIEKGLALPTREKDDPMTKARGRETLRELLAKSGAE